MRPVKVIEVDLESDDESDDGVKETQPVDVSVGETESPTEKKTEKHGATKAVGAAAEVVGATAAEGVGARFNRKLDKDESGKVMSPDRRQTISGAGTCAAGRILEGRDGMDNTKVQEASR